MAVYKRGVIWYYDIQVAGRRIKRATGAADKRAAQVEAELAKRKAAAPPADGAGLLLQDAIMRCYKEEWKDKKSGLKMVNRVLKVVDILGDIPIQRVNEEAIAKMVAELEKRKLAPASINRYRAYLRRILNLANKKWQVLDRVPYIRNTPEVAQRFKVYTQEEERRILSCSNHEFVGLATILFDTGMRVSEALRLEKAEVDFDTNSITVWGDATKSGKSRGVPMTRRVRQLLENRTLPFQFKNLDEVERVWERMRKELGGKPDWLLHSMRHTFASRLVRRGVDLYTVGSLLGHSTVTVTERYAHLNPAKLAQAVSLLEGEQCAY
jgi:integrase